jgi:uncharacterized membrane protein
MKTKLLLLLLVVPLHAFLSFALLQSAFNPPPGGHSNAFWFSWGIISAPLLLPLVMFDPDGKTLPMWLQIASLPLNSLIWGVALLFLVVVVKRWRGRLARGQG